MTELTKKKCVPCEGKGIMPMEYDAALALMDQVPGWSLIQGEVYKLSRTFFFDDFMSAIHFVQKIAHVAEREGHHPDIAIHYNKVILELYTHSIKGLHENDFILAAKINTIK